MAAGPIPPPPPERNGTPAKGRWGWANDLVVIQLNVDREKLWLQDLYPLRRRGTGLRRKDDGVGLTISSPVSSMSIEKKYGCRTYTPPRRREREPGKKNEGVGKRSRAQESNRK